MTKTLTQQQQQVWDALRLGPAEWNRIQLQAKAQRKIQHHFNGDLALMMTVMNIDGEWSWQEAIAYWDDDDIAAAIQDYNRLTQQQRYATMKQV